MLNSMLINNNKSSVNLWDSFIHASVIIGFAYYFYEQDLIKDWYSYYLQNGLVLLLIIAFTGLFLSLVIQESDVKHVSLGTSCLLLLLTIWIMHYYNKSSFSFQFVYTFFSILSLDVSLAFGIDGISLCFLLLTVIIFPICILASWDISKLQRHFFVFLLILEILLILTFVTTDIFFFFVFFESILIPMYMMIGIWGSRIRKIKASFYFFLYTLFGSMFMLFGLLYIYSIIGSSSYDVILHYEFTLWQEYILWGCFFVAFAAKIPMFPFHLWLPEAHVEAPTIGSVILASLLLKLGGYGFLRFSLSMLPNASYYFVDLVVALALVSIVYASLTTIRQIDLKRIIAYSSIAHMNLLVLGLFSFNQQGIEGAIYLMIAHGVVSSGLFFCVGVLYDRYHTRIIKYYSGLVQVMPVFTTCFFLFTLANMSFPGTSNFVGELLVLIGVFQYNTIVVFFAATGIVLSAVYSIWVFNRICFGTLKVRYFTTYFDITKLEFFVFIPLLILMIILGINSNIIIELFSTNVSATLALTFISSLECAPGRETFWAWAQDTNHPHRQEILAEINRLDSQGNVMGSLNRYNELRNEFEFGVPAAPPTPIQTIDILANYLADQKQKSADRYWRETPMAYKKAGGNEKPTKGAWGNTGRRNNFDTQAFYILRMYNVFSHDRVPIGFTFNGIDYYRYRYFYKKTVP